MTLWFVLALMTAAAIFAVLWPLSRRPQDPATDGTEIAVYRDQLEEIERDRKAGLIPQSEAEAARLEISRRLLAAAEGAEKPRSKKETAAPVWRKRVAALIALVALPVMAAGRYCESYRSRSHQ